jgi:hypothetical protein
MKYCSVNCVWFYHMAFGKLAQNLFQEVCLHGIDGTAYSSAHEVQQEYTLILNWRLEVVRIFDHIFSVQVYYVWARIYTQNNFLFEGYSVINVFVKWLNISTTICDQWFSVSEKCKFRFRFRHKNSVSTLHVKKLSINQRPIQFRSWQFSKFYGSNVIEISSKNKLETCNSRCVIIAPRQKQNVSHFVFTLATKCWKFMVDLWPLWVNNQCVSSYRAGVSWFMYGCWLKGGI